MVPHFLSDYLGWDDDDVEQIRYVQLDQIALWKYHFDYKNETPTASVVSKSSQKSLTVT